MTSNLCSTMALSLMLRKPLVRGIILSSVLLNFWSNSAWGLNTIRVNGELKVTAPWSSTVGHPVTIADWWLEEQMGVELLNSDSPEVQPVRWLGQVVTLPVVWQGSEKWLTNRYLDVAPLSALGWQVNPQGELLDITLPVQPPTVSLDRQSPMTLDYRQNRESRQVWAKGLVYRKLIAQTPVPQRIHILEVDKTYPLLPMSTQGRATVLSQMGQNAQAAAGINGGYFNLKIGQPVGALKREGQWLSSPILERGAVAWDNGGTWRFGRVGFTGTSQWTDGTGTKTTLPLVGFNTAYVESGVAAYTALWGAVYQTRTQDEIVIPVVEGKAAPASMLEAVGTTVPIPAQGYLLVARGTGRLLLMDKSPGGFSVTFTHGAADPGVEALPNIVGGGPLLLQDGKNVLDGKREQFQPDVLMGKAPRTLLGRRGDGTILLVTVDGRQTDAKGMTLEEATNFMQSLGAVDALNLDGGGSTTFYLGGKVRNQPSDGHERPLPNGLAVLIPRNVPLAPVPASPTLLRP
ncbi:MAG: phosphodiester glycosidase family protein [Gloeobacterales cyanobacterium]